MSGRFRRGGSPAATWRCPDGADRHVMGGGRLVLVVVALLVSPPLAGQVDYLLESLLHQRQARAAAGDSTAQYQVGEMYLKGRGTPVDYSRAREWLGRAAGAGHVKARFKLGYMDLKGLGAEPSPDAALPRIRAAAEEGYPPAQFYLGQMYALGDGLDRDSAQAVRWIEASLEEGYRPPTRELETIRRVLDGRP